MSAKNRLTFTKDYVSSHTAPIPGNRLLKDRRGMKYAGHTVHSFFGYIGKHVAWWCFNENDPDKYYVMTAVSLTSLEGQRLRKEKQNEVPAKVPERQVVKGFYLRAHSTDRFLAFQMDAHYIGAVDTHNVAWIPLAWIRSVDTTPGKSLTSMIYNNRKNRRLRQDACLRALNNSRPSYILMNINDVMAFFKNDLVRRPWEKSYRQKLEAVYSKIVDVLYSVNNSVRPAQPETAEQAGVVAPQECMVGEHPSKTLAQLVMSFFKDNNIPVTQEVYLETTDKVIKACFEHEDFKLAIDQIRVIMEREFTDEIKKEALISLFNKKSA